MIIWELLLKDEDICVTLRRLYAEMGVGPLANNLGISRVTLIKKLKECGIESHTRGGPHNRVDMSTLPDKWWQFPTEELAELTGYCYNYCRKLKRSKVCELEAILQKSTDEKSQKP